ncbi:hypothetical protein RJ641_009418 [Dillenia turbinata]|uniref:Uncharacterized protein n=1 Tax=Dillenia turbinata TaxID=194707 RepID=A0AAN8VCX4_9MAGN
MPGNDGGDRVHNFFGQDNINQSQHHSQVVDVNWQALSNNLWVGNQRQTAASSYPKNFTVQQLVPDSERVHGNHSLLLPRGMNSSQSNLRPEFSKSWSHVQRPNLNGYVFGNQAFQTRPNETNLLGVDTESDRHIATSRGLSMFELQHGNAPEQHDKNFFMSQNAESPVNYDFLGSQQQMNGQQLGMMQSLQREQSGIGDMQLLQQQVMLKQMEELQRQQQLQQLEARRQSSMDQMLSVAKHNHPSSLVNGTTSHDAPNHVWPSEVVAGNTNWQHRGASPAVLGSSNDLMISPDPGQALRLVPQQVDQSLYGFPVSSTRGTLNQYSRIEMDKSASNQMTVSGNSIPGNQSQFSDQVGLRDGSVVSRQVSNAKNLFRHGSSDGFNSSLPKENFQLADAQEKVSSLQELHETHDLVGTSEVVNEKRGMQTSSSANVVALDPTEERILFGADDNNIWEVFGGSRGGSNLLDGVNAFPSLQSGSWSALMQSAVAETSSGDVGSQEWSGAGFHSTELPVGNRQSSTFSDGGRQPMFGTDTKMVSSSNYRIPISNDATTATNNCSLVEFPHPGTQFLNEQSDRLQSGRNISVPQSMDGSKWLDCRLPEKNRAGGSQIGQTSVHGSGAELNPKSISNAWKQDESISSYNNVSQKFRKFNGWSDSTSMSPSENANMTIRERESPQASGATNLKRSMHEETGHGGRPWRDNSASNSAAELEHMKSSWQVNPQSLRLSNAPAVLNSGIIKENLQNAHQLSSNHQFDLLKGAEALAKHRGNEEIGKNPRNLNQGPTVSESLQNNVDKGAAERYEIDRNCDRKENSSDSHRSNSSLHASTSGPRENNWLDASNSHALTGKQNSSAQVGNKPTRKFQYHPMGNLDADVEPSYGAKHITNLQALSQQFPRGFRSHEQMSFGQSSLLGHASQTSTDSEKRPSPDFHGHKKKSDDSSLGGVIQGFVQPSGRSEGAYEPNRSANSSPNMLELLHKVDWSRDSGNSANFSPDHNLSSEVLETEASDGSVGRLQQNQPSGTQSFGLQLAPPTQRLPVKTNNLFSQSSSQKNNTPSPHLANSERGEKGPMWLSPTAQSLPLHGTAQGELRPNNLATHSWAGDEASTYSRLGNYSAGMSSGSSHFGSQSQNKLYSGPGLQGTVNLSANISSDGLASQLKQTDDFNNISGHSLPVSLAESASVISRGSLPAPAGLSQSEGIEHSRAKVSVQQFASPASQPFVPSITSQPGKFSTMSHNVRINDPTQRSTLGSQTHKGPFQSFHPSGDKQESTSSAPRSSDGQDILKDPSNLDGASPCFVNRDKQHNGSPWQQVTSEKSELAQKSLELQEKESMPKNLPNASSKAASQKDIEAFGRSLKPNSLFHQKYSLLQQMQAMKSSEADPSNRGVKRFKGKDNSAEAQQLSPPRAGQQLPQGPNIVVGDASVQCASVQCGDSKILSFSSEPEDDKNKNASSQPVHVHLPPQDVTGFGPRESQSDASSSVSGSLRSEHPRVSPQMAPSWFSQYGTFKNGQMFPIFDGRKVAAMKTLEQHYVLGKSSDIVHTEQVNSATGPSQVGSVPESSSATTMDGAHLPSDAWPPNVINGSLVPLHPKKRKSATADLLPWHREVAQVARRLLNISVAEQDWAQAANRVIERIEDDVELIEDGPVMMLKSKRRLVLTTLLMQQLLKAPPAAILFSDARSNYDCVAYFVSRLALGNACSLAFSGSDSSVPGDSINFFSEKSKASERVGDQHVSKVVEEFLDKVKMMENELLRLDKRASILDIRMECQDLEKFAVINRFAKFHGRGQHEGAESSSSDGVLNNQKSCPQRYVTALPTPRNLPDRTPKGGMSGFLI